MWKIRKTYILKICNHLHSSIEEFNPNTNTTKELENKLKLGLHRYECLTDITIWHYPKAWNLLYCLASIRLSPWYYHLQSPHQWPFSLSFNLTHKLILSSSSISIIPAFLSLLWAPYFQCKSSASSCSFPLEAL